MRTSVKMLFGLIMCLALISATRVKYRPGKDARGYSEKQNHIQMFHTALKKKDGAAFIKGFSKSFKEKLLKHSGQKSIKVLGKIVSKFLSDSYEPKKYVKKPAENDYITIVFPDSLLVVRKDSLFPEFVKSMSKKGLAEIPKEWLNILQGDRYIQENGEWKYTSRVSLSGHERDRRNSDFAKAVKKLGQELK